MIRFDVAPYPAEPPVPPAVWIIAAVAVLLAAAAIALIRLAKQHKAKASAAKKPD